MTFDLNFNSEIRRDRGKNFLLDDEPIFDYISKLTQNKINGTI